MSRTIASSGRALQDRGLARVVLGSISQPLGLIPERAAPRRSTCRSRTPVLPDRVTFCGERVGDSSTVGQRTLTPAILVRIQVHKQIKSISWRIVSADLARAARLISSNPAHDGKGYQRQNQRAAIEIFSPNEIKFDSTKLSTRRLLLNFAPIAVLYSGSKECPRYPWPADQVCPPSARDKALHISHEDK
jgi:hypothetical protein